MESKRLYTLKKTEIQNRVIMPLYSTNLKWLECFGYTREVSSRNQLFGIMPTQLTILYWILKFC